MPSIEQAAGEAGSDALAALLRVAHNDDGTLQQSAAQAAIGGSRAFTQDADPSLSMTAGTEYVWFQMDGSGTLLDIKFGKA